MDVMDNTASQVQFLQCQNVIFSLSGIRCYEWIKCQLSHLSAWICKKNCQTRVTHSKFKHLKRQKWTSLAKNFWTRNSILKEFALKPFSFNPFLQRETHSKFQWTNKMFSNWRPKIFFSSQKVFSVSAHPIHFRSRYFTPFLINSIWCLDDR